MTDHDLDAEYEALRAEQAELDAEHERLKVGGGDMAAHRAHVERLHAHIERLRRYAAARDLTGPPKP